MSILTDTHCHLNYQWFDKDLDEVLERAWEAGVERILIPGFDMESSRKAIQLSENNPRLFAAIGIHPNDAEDWNMEYLPELKDLVQHPKVLAIGEIGLDYYRDRAPRDLQQKIFNFQLELCADIKKPVIIHSRQAMQDVWQILEKWQEDLLISKSPIAQRPGVLHAYEGDLETASKLIYRNFYIGLGGSITYKNARKKLETIANLPIESILLETDSPFLPPHPHRGERNEPSYVSIIAEFLTQTHNTVFDDICQKTSENSDKLFEWSLFA